MNHAASTRRLLLLSPIVIAACTLSLLRSPLPAPALPKESAAASSTAVTPPQTVMPTPGFEPQGSPDLRPTLRTAPLFCDDERPLRLVEEFKKAIESKDGALLASLVSPSRGMDARLLRDGRIVNYDREHAAALFESTYTVDWGVAAGSGLPIKGSFGELFIPELMDVFSRQYTQACNVIQAGGTTYPAQWPYQDLDFYSVHYPGSAAYGALDWHTWGIGIHLVDDEPYLYAIMQFKWEP